MCEVTWNTWESVSAVLMPISMKASCIVAPLSLVCSLLLSVSLDCLSLFRTHHTALARVWVRTHHMSSHLHGSCALLCVSLIASTFALTSSPSSPSLWSPCSSFCPTTSTSTMWWTNTLRTSAQDLATLAENEPPTQIWLSIIHMTCRHSIECIMWRDFEWTTHTVAKSSWDGCTIVQEVSLCACGYGL